MKPFEYYESPKAEFYSFIWAREEYNRRCKAIDETPMTVDQRRKAREELKTKIDAEAKERNKPFIEEAEDLYRQFWEDMRVSLGYGALFDKKGVERFEEAVKYFKDEKPKDYDHDYIPGDFEELYDMAKLMLKHYKFLRSKEVCNAFN